MSEIERRYTKGIEVRAEDGKPPMLVGYAAVFNKWSCDLGGFREQIMPGAFKRTLTEDGDVRALLNHDANFVLGRGKSGTARLIEDSVGLRVEIDLPDTTAGRDTRISVDRGDLDGMSFAFATIEDAWDYSGDVAERSLKDVDLSDVSVVTYPAYPDTSVAVRSLTAWKEAREPETEDAPIRETLKRQLRMRETT